MAKLKNPLGTRGYPIFFDLEVYPNYFLALFYDKGRWRAFDDSDLVGLKKYLSDESKVLVGYNSLNFDEPIMKAILAGDCSSATAIYQLCKKIIHQDTLSQEDDKYLKSLRWRKSIWGTSIDLMQLEFQGYEGGFGNTSLKHLAISLEHLLIEDLPYDPDMELNNDQKNMVLAYCKNDVIILIKLWETKRIQDALEVRLELESMFGVKCLSLSKPRTAEVILKKDYAERLELDIKDLKKPRADFYDIFLGDCLPAVIKFDRKDLQEQLDIWRKLKFPYTPKGYDTSSFVGIPLRFGGTTFSVGIGGLHSEDEPGIFHSSKDSYIVDCDVESYYPAIVQKFGIRPWHLSDAFNKTFQNILERRVSYKQQKQDIKSNSLKTVLNSTVGKFAEMFSFFYDPKAFYSVTLIGQFSLLMLAEKLSSANIEILSANTDGLTCRMEYAQLSKYGEICKSWQMELGYKLEFSIYQSYIRNSVNDYFALKENGKVKRKGDTFAEPTMEAKQDALIIREVVIQYFLNGADYASLIRAEKNLLKFCFSFRCHRGFSPILYNTETLERTPIQKTNRWYVSTSSCVLVKEKAESNKLTALANGQALTVKGEIKKRMEFGVTLANRLENTEVPSDLAYDYYIDEAKKVIDHLEATKPQKLLFQTAWF